MPFGALKKFSIGVLPNFDEKSHGLYFADFHPTYPDFQKWLNTKVIPETIQNPTQRDVIFALSSDNSSIAGFSILKNTALEKKICSFYIVPAFQKMGYGSSLMEECFKILGTSTPMITMPQKCKDLFKNLLSKYGFEFKHELSNYYVDGETECVFNGILH